MKISGKTLLQIDRLFRLPQKIAGALLNVFGRIDRSPLDRIMVIKFMGLGSLTQLASLCEKQNINKNKIVLLTLKSNEDLCTLMGFRNTVFIRIQNIFMLLMDCVTLYSSVRKMKIAFVVDFERCSHAVSLFRSVLCYFARCRSLSFMPSDKNSSISHTILPVDKFNQQQLFLKGLEQVPSFTETLKKTRKEIDPLKILISINSSNYFLARRYSIECFAEVIRALHAFNPSYDIYLTGSAEESDYVFQLEKKLGELKVTNSAGKWSLARLQSELSTCALFITCDSGPLHMAVAFEVQTIAIWGPTQPEHFGYQHINNLHNVSLGLACSPCLTTPASHPAIACCQRIDCLKDFSPQIVIGKAKALLTVGQQLKSTVHDIGISRLAEPSIL
jgi:hypothetical protein